MGRKRDTDRMGHVLLKFAAIEIARISQDLCDNLDDKQVSRKKLALSTNAIEEMVDTFIVIGSLMAKAESAKEFGFSAKDADNMSVSDLCDVLDVKKDVAKTKRRKHDIDEIIKKAVAGVAKDIGVPENEIHVGKIDSSDLIDILDALTKKEGKK